MRYYTEYLTIKHEHLHHDCYALVRKFYENEFGIVLTPFSYAEDWADTGENLIMDNYDKVGFHSTEGLDFSYGNVILFGGDGKTARHMGVSLGDGTFLHTSKNGTSRHRYNNSIWSALIVATVKYERDHVNKDR